MDDTGVITGQILVPAADEVPEGKENPEVRFGKINNLAGDKKVCDDFWSHAGRAFSRYDGQDMREDWFNSSDTRPSKLDNMDRMWRLSQKRDKSSAQYHNTLSNVTSQVYYEVCRTISAALSTIGFGDKEMPAKYEAELNTDDYDATVGMEIAKSQQLVEVYTFDEDKRRAKIKKSLKFLEKNCNQMVSLQWVFETREVTENIPTGIDEDGSPKGFKRVMKRRVVKDWSSYRNHDIKDCWFDCQIDDMSQQRLFLIRDKIPYETLIGWQEEGFVKNVDKIQASHFYRGDDEDLLEDRLKNSGSDTYGNPDADGLVEIWDVKGWAPIKEKKRSGNFNGKGEWNPNHRAGYYWGTYAGHPNQGGVCLRLELDPYWQVLGYSNYKFLHSEEDDKGAYHDGTGTRIESLYAEATTNLNQAIDSKTLRMNAPFACNGNVEGNLAQWRSNNMVKIQRGAQIWKLDVPDTTQITLPMQERIERTAMKLGGADKPLTAEALGSRTSATESKNVFDMALMPLDEKAAYIFEDQLFPWMFETDALLWRAWADPKTKLSVTQGGEVFEVMPSRLWGPVKTKVVAVSRFRNDIVSRQELNSLLQGTYQYAEKYMGPDGARKLWRQVYGKVVDDVEEIFPEGGNFEATTAAWKAIQTLITGGWIQPNADENHEVWLRFLKPVRAELNTITNEDWSAAGYETPLEEVKRSFDQHILLREQFLTQRQEQNQAPQQASETPALPGQASGDLIEGQEGQLAGGATL